MNGSEVSVYISQDALLTPCHLHVMLHMMQQSIYMILSIRFVLPETVNRCCFTCLTGIASTATGIWRILANQNLLMTLSTFPLISSNIFYLCFSCVKWRPLRTSCPLELVPVGALNCILVRGPSGGWITDCV